MKINILGYTVAITATKADILSRVDKLAQTYPVYGSNRVGTLVCRVKAYRELMKGTTIKEAKEWVESHFAD